MLLFGDATKTEVLTLASLSVFKTMGNVLIDLSDRLCPRCNSVLAKSVGLYHVGGNAWGPVVEPCCAEIKPIIEDLVELRYPTLRG